MQRTHPVLFATLAGMAGAVLSVAVYLLLSGGPVDATTVGLFIVVGVVLALMTYRHGGKRQV